MSTISHPGWVDDNYDGSNFVVKKGFFCDGGQDVFSKQTRDRYDLVKFSTKIKAEYTLRIGLDGL